jgi:hypothetical protein
MVKNTAITMRQLRRLRHICEDIEVPPSLEKDKLRKPNLRVILSDTGTDVGNKSAELFIVV